MLPEPVPEGAAQVRLAAQGVCAAGELVKHVVQAGVQAGHGADLSSWSGAAIQFAVEQTNAFEASHRKPSTSKKDVA